MRGRPSSIESMPLCARTTRRSLRAVGVPALACLHRSARPGALHIAVRVPTPNAAGVAIAVSRRRTSWILAISPFREVQGGCVGEDESVQHRARSQWIVAARPLCHLQCPVTYLSRLQRIQPAASSELRSKAAARGSSVAGAAAYDMGPWVPDGPYCRSSSGQRGVAPHNSMDSSLEAFSHNPAHALPPITSTFRALCMSTPVVLGDDTDEDPMGGHRNEHRESINWSKENTKKFIDICYEKVKQNKLQGTTFKKETWEAINRELFLATNEDYGVDRVKGKSGMVET
ncbi:hypothetical protein J5N97_028224 [Dioscorea zingiberensis]|uniref:Myb/SANT-like domain-containing protein n=1 Tax=Dioscorea zingiberensis TaxID=325984 RepID=A0A9D5BZ48_9LILI|nr:hypothetical protein J5N97_028224 [Dioscorea zingiberensis]